MTLSYVINIVDIWLNNEYGCLCTDIIIILFTSKEYEKKLQT